MNSIIQVVTTTYSQINGDLQLKIYLGDIPLHLAYQPCLTQDASSLISKYLRDVFTPLFRHLLPPNDGCLFHSQIYKETQLKN